MHFHSVHLALLTWMIPCLRWEDTEKEEDEEEEEDTYRFKNKQSDDTGPEMEEIEEIEEKEEEEEQEEEWGGGERAQVARYTVSKQRVR